MELDLWKLRKSCEFRIFVEYVRNSRTAVRNYFVRFQFDADNES
jgi:hypothetical protein